MEITKKDTFIKQIMIYIKNKDYGNAYLVAKEFNEKYPDDLISNFLLAKACFYLNKYDEALIAGRKTFALSTGQDIVTAAVLLGSIYFMRHEFVEGYKLLESLENNKKIRINSEIEELLTIFSLALNNPQQAMRHVDRLYQLNSRYAEDFIVRFFE
jgi:tetratricopeptide (TPR) repeat protein